MVTIDMKNNKSGMDKLKKWNRILEKVWLVIAISTLLFSIVIASIEGWVWKKVMVYFLLSQIHHLVLQMDWEKYTYSVLLMDYLQKESGE